MGIRLSRPPVTTATVAALTAATAAVVAASPPPASAATSTFTPVADTYVQSDTTSTNYGTATQIVVDNSPVRRTVPAVHGERRQRHGHRRQAAAAHHQRQRRQRQRRHVPGHVQHDLVGDRHDVEQPAGDRRRDPRQPRLGQPHGWYEIDVTARGDRQRHVQHRRELDQHRRRLLRLAGERRRRPAAGAHHRHHHAAAVGRPGAGRRRRHLELRLRRHRHRGTARRHPRHRLHPGDNVYNNGTAGEFSTYYQPDVGPAQGAHPPVTGQPRLQHLGRDRATTTTSAPSPARPGGATTRTTWATGTSSR